MKNLNALPLILGFITIIALGACQSTNRGYSSSRVWDNNGAAAQQAAKTAPNTLATGHIEAQELAAAADKNPDFNTGPQAPELQRSTVGANKPPVKVAMLLPLSGDNAHLGESMLRSAQLALFDVAHANFELLTRDTKGTAEGARNAARGVLAEGADLILGPVFASSVRAVKPVARNANVSVIGFSTDWTLAGENTYIMGFLPFDQVERLVNYTNKRNIGRVSVISPNNSYGNAVTGAWQSASARLGVPPAQVTKFSLTNPNLAPTLRRTTKYDERTQQAKEQNTNTLNIEPPFDAVLMPVGGETALSIGNLLSHYDLPPKSVKRLGTGLFDDGALATESSLNGAWFAAPSPKLRKGFEQRYLSAYSASAPRLATLAYDATALAAVLAQRGQNAEGSSIFSHSAITNPNGFAGIDGIFRFRPDGTAERGLAILEFRRGTIRVIEDAPTTFQNMAY